MKPRPKTSVKLQPPPSKRQAEASPSAAASNRPFLGAGVALGAGLIVISLAAAVYSACGRTPVPSAVEEPPVAVRIPVGEAEVAPASEAAISTAGSARSVPSTKVTLVRVPREKAIQAFAPFHGDQLAFPERTAVKFTGAGTYLVVTSASPSGHMLAAWDEIGIVLRETYGPQSLEVFVPSEDAFRRMLGYEVETALFMGASSASAK